MQTIRLMKYRRTIFGLAIGLLFTGVAHAQQFKVCATVPELGSLVHEIGGDRATVTVFAKGTEDPATAPASPVTLNMPAPTNIPIMVAYPERGPKSRRSLFWLFIIQVFYINHI